MVHVGGVSYVYVLCRIMICAAFGNIGGVKFLSDGSLLYMVLLGRSQYVMLYVCLIRGDHFLLICSVFAI